MRKHGMLVAGQSGSLRWSYGGQANGNISYFTQSSCLVVTYNYKERGEEEWTKVNERLPFTFTEQRLGGLRRWFQCLSCKRRCTILYGGTKFRCRKCYGLAYSTQNENVMYRSLTRAQKLRNRLGGSLCVDDPFPAKPKRMHWRTYHKLRIGGEAQENRVHDISENYLEQISRRLKGGKI